MEKPCDGGLVAKSCPTLVTPMDCSPQAPLSVGFSRQEYWSGLPFSSPVSCITYWQHLMPLSGINSLVGPSLSPCILPPGKITFLHCLSNEMALAMMSFLELHSFSVSLPGGVSKRYRI